VKATKRLVVVALACTPVVLMNTGATAEAPKAPLPPAEFVQQNLKSPPVVDGKIPRGIATARSERLSKTGASYSKKFDLSGLPVYAPKEKVSGLIRIWGNNYMGDSGLSEAWAEEFKSFHPDARFEFVLPSSAIAFFALTFGTADLGMQQSPGFYDSLAHVRVLGYEPTGIKAVTGSADTAGWLNTMAIVVHKDNPLTRISMPQLDGVFGAIRAGGWDGTTWNTKYARGRDKDIRTWGQLGLQGDWKDTPIQPYGYSFAYNTAWEFSARVLQSSDKWNGETIGYGNLYNPDGTVTPQVDQIMDSVRKDPYAIGYVRYTKKVLEGGGLKVLALAPANDSPAVEISVDNVQSGIYPLTAHMSFWMSIAPNQKLDPKVKEFLRYILSRQAQEVVQEVDRKYLPLNASMVKAELTKLERL